MTSSNWSPASSVEAMGHPPAEVRDLLTRRIDDIDSRITELRSFRRTLHEHFVACEQALAVATEPECPTRSKCSIERSARVRSMKHGERIAPVAAALTGLATLACCLPVGFAAAAVTAGLSTVVAAYQSWFLGASVVLLAVGLVQLNQVQRTCSRRPYASFIVFGVSAVIVLLVVLFPQAFWACSRTGCPDVRDESPTNIRSRGIGDCPRGGNGWYRFRARRRSGGPACACDARFDVTSDPSSRLQSGFEPPSSHRPAVPDVSDLSAGGLRSRIAAQATRERSDPRVRGVATHATDRLVRACQLGPERLSDRRVQRSWDPNHVLATQMKNDARAPQPVQDCCLRSGILWDLAALYPPGATWSDGLPSAGSVQRTSG